jgi:hypothetical protein
MSFHQRLKFTRTHIDRLLFVRSFFHFFACLFILINSGHCSYTTSCKSLDVQRNTIFLQFQSFQLKQ